MLNYCDLGFRFISSNSKMLYSSALFFLLGQKVDVFNQDVHFEYWLRTTFLENCLESLRDRDSLFSVLA
jgi:hypothetical protein